MKSKILLFFLLISSFWVYAQGDYNHEIKEYRKKYRKDFLSDKKSPLQHKKQLRYLRFYEPDVTYRIKTRFTATPDEAPFEMQTYSKKTKTFVKYGYFTFEIQNQNCTLSVYKRIYSPPNPLDDGMLFIPFKDLTSAKETYGGGRYLDLDAKEIRENIFELDFNKCYNPYCAYSSGYSCPVPPEENHLPVEIKAGEKIPEMPAHE